MAVRLDHLGRGVILFRVIELQGRKNCDGVKNPPFCTCKRAKIAKIAINLSVRATESTVTELAWNGDRRKSEKSNPCRSRIFCKTLGR